MRRLALALLLTPAVAAASPWDGTWTLDATRSSAGAAEFAAPGYRFAIMPDEHVTWEIPAIGEVVRGVTDGAPMPVHRRKLVPGMTLSVRADGPWTLRYQVAHGGKVDGEGIMRLIEGGKAWVDLSWRADKPEDAGALVYVRQPAPGLTAR